MGIAELTSGYKITYTRSGITAQRQFIEDIEAEVGAGNTGVTVPVVGDLFHDPAERLQHLFCISVDQSYLANDKRKILYICSYSNEVVDNANMHLEYTAPTGIDDLPQDWEYGGEYQLWTANLMEYPNSRWAWDDERTRRIASAIPFRVRTINRKFSRIVPEAQRANFETQIYAILGKVNEDEWQSGGVGCWLFTGVHSEIFRDQRDDRAYKFDLSFSYRDPDGLNLDGWQKILDETGKWRRPYNLSVGEGEGGSGLYQTASFDGLFSDAAGES